MAFFRSEKLSNLTFIVAFPYELECVRRRRRCYWVHYNDIRATYIFHVFDRIAYKQQ